jgi:hypothetical protein
MVAQTATESIIFIASMNIGAKAARVFQDSLQQATLAAEALTLPSGE